MQLPKFLQAVGSCPLLSNHVETVKISGLCRPTHTRAAPPCMLPHWTNNTRVGICIHFKASWGRALGSGEGEAELRQFNKGLKKNRRDFDSAVPRAIFPLISRGGRLYWTCFHFQIRITGNDACISYHVDKAGGPGEGLICNKRWAQAACLSPLSLINDERQRHSKRVTAINSSLSRPST